MSKKKRPKKSSEIRSKKTKRSDHSSDQTDIGNESTPGIKPKLELRLKRKLWARLESGIVAEIKDEIIAVKWSEIKERTVVQSLKALSICVWSDKVAAHSYFHCGLGKHDSVSLGSGRKSSLENTAWNTISWTRANMVAKARTILTGLLWGLMAAHSNDPGVDVISAESSTDCI